MKIFGGVCFLLNGNLLVGVWKDSLIARVGKDAYDAAVRTAQAEYDQHQPDVIVGSSRGGAVALNINSRDTPLVLLCPAWKKWGTVSKLKPNALILHSRKDDVIRFKAIQEDAWFTP